MFGVSFSSLFKALFACLALGISLILASCGKDPDVAEGPAPVARVTVLGLVNPTPDLEKAWKKGGPAVGETCFRYIKSGASERPRVEGFSVGCDQLQAGLSPVLSLEVRDWIDPSQLGVESGIYLLYQGLLPVGEMKKNGSGFDLVDLCTLDNFYRNACRLQVRETRLTALQINQVAMGEQLRAQRRLEAEMRAVKDGNEKNIALLAKLNEHLQKLSGQIVGQKEAIQAHLVMLEGPLAKEEKRLSDLLTGVKKKVGLEEEYTTSLESVRTLTAELTQAQAQGAEAQKAYGEKRDHLQASGTAFEALIKKRQDLKAEIAALSVEEQVSRQPELVALEAEIAKQVLVLADETAALKASFAELRKTPEYQAEAEALQKLGAAKQHYGEVAKLLELAKDKLSAVRLAKSHVATANKFVAENQLKEATVVLPVLFRLVEKIAAFSGV